MTKGFKFLYPLSWNKAAYKWLPAATMFDHTLASQGMKGAAQCCVG